MWRYLVLAVHSSRGLPTLGGPPERQLLQVSAGGCLVAETRHREPLQHAGGLQYPGFKVLSRKHECPPLLSSPASSSPAMPPPTPRSVGRGGGQAGLGESVIQSLPRLPLCQSRLLNFSTKVSQSPCGRVDTPPWMAGHGNQTHGHPEFIRKA